MAVYSTNQNRQLYVVKNVADATPTAEGGIYFRASDEKIYFQYYGKGGLIRSDLIDKASITRAHITTADKMQRPLRKATVTVSADALSSSKPIVGQDYILRIYVRNFMAPGDANVLIKHGVVHVGADMTLTDFYTKMKDSLVSNFSRESSKLFNFTASASGVVIEEVEQPWYLGLRAQDRVNFEVAGATITKSAEEISWATVVMADSTTKLGNGHDIADLEYFCLGERADQYRMKGWPNVIPTQYMVDPAKEYDVLDIHYSFADDGISLHKSEKDITIVAETAESDALINSVKTKLTSLGVTVTPTA